ncbi:hypothetical protein [Laribacter hongkongensis]|uniref:hypothetical protein n=1 Tax=Laribacter hongkongensis TaxID=168471 RepID=UPI001EFD748E|nr:hypothetical protein [Laribacter hongkongensis]MCG9031182.1 hypothetical protein [Laribacter hongkongensis]MCG9092503.1 hypothetical protein [Laribacter hongkongensis]
MTTRKPIKLPRSKTAAMLLMQQLAASGHYYYLSGQIPKTKLGRFLPKLEQFGIYRDAPGRAYDRRRRWTSVHLIVVELDDTQVFWYLLSTAGKGGLADPAVPSLGTVKDTRLRGQHLRFLAYELLEHEKRMPKVKTTTWTWRIEPTRYAELQAAAVQTVRERDRPAIIAMIERNSAMTLFSGVRGQVFKLNHLAGKLANKFGRGEIELPALPYIVKQPIYNAPPRTLEELLALSQR